MSKPMIYIAAPLFNQPQIETIKGIEELCNVHQFGFFSPRLHSGSTDLTPEQKKTQEAWKPVFESNERALKTCRVLLAVLSYELPDGQQFGLTKYDPTSHADDFTPIELPDAGVVWECGYARAIDRIVVGFHPEEAKRLNLMLSHGCDAIIQGWDNLKKFFASSNVEGVPVELRQKAGLSTQNSFIASDLANFDWTACRFQGEVE